MTDQSGQKSRFDKNLRSFLEAVSMLEREAAVLLDRLGIDGETVRRGVDVVGAVSGGLLRQLAGSAGLADAKTVDMLSRDLRGLLERVARLREQQRDARSRVDGRMDRMEQSSAKLDAALQAMARVQGRAQARLAALEERASSLDSKVTARGEQLELMEGLRLRIERLEGVVTASTADLRARKPGVTPGTPRRKAARVGDSPSPIREERPEPVAAQPRSR